MAEMFTIHLRNAGVFYRNQKNWRIAICSEALHKELKLAENTRDLSFTVHDKPVPNGIRFQLIPHTDILYYSIRKYNRDGNVYEESLLYGFTEALFHRFTDLHPNKTYYFTYRSKRYAAE